MTKYHVSISTLCLWVDTYLASSVRAMIPEARGVADDVPEKSLMQVSLFPVVVCNIDKTTFYYRL